MNFIKWILTVLLPIGLFGQPSTLDNCEENISANVPSFFQKYFKCVDMSLSESGNYVNLYYSGLAPYDSWYYENDHPNHIDWYSQGPDYFLIPNAYITEYDYVISIPVDPEPRPNLVIDADAVDGEVGSSNFEYPMGSVGSALNGVNMFNPCASPPDVIEDEAYSFDLYNGHPAGPSGIYHYHTNSAGPLEVLAYNLPDVVTNTTPGTAEVEVYGIMCDGAVVLGCTELDGSAPDASDWDAQNGHVHDLVDEEGVTHFTNRYHTHICYNEITDEDTDGNGFQEHEFTPEISYYKTPGMGQSHERCGAMTSPYEPDEVLGVGVEFYPESFTLFNNYPNPFNPVTTIRYDIQERIHVFLRIYDLSGTEISQLVNTTQEPGIKSVQWNGTDFMGRPVSAGVYFVILKSNGFTDSQKIILLK